MSMQKVALEKYQVKIFEELKELEEQRNKRIIGAIGTSAQVGKIGK